MTTRDVRQHERLGAARRVGGAVGVEFAVDDVTSDGRPLPEVPAAVALVNLAHPHTPSPETAGGAGVEAHAHPSATLVSGVGFHAGLAAIHIAFDQHRPLVLSPDVVWLFIVQGFAHHVNANAEAVRRRFVSHEGQKRIVVRRDDLVKGSPSNPWMSIFAAFAAEIRDEIGVETHDALVPAFSTTGPIERAAMQVALMDSMQRYFSYGMSTRCGIPSIRLEGTPEDWKRLATHARALASFGLETWLHYLDPILKEFVAAAGGRVHPAFWRSIYKDGGMSGGPRVTGWINVFFPYLEGENGNFDRLSSWMLGDAGSWRDLRPPRHPRADYDFPTRSAFPTGLATAPLDWDYLGKPYEMQFVGGFVGVAQEPETLAVRPQIGWAVWEPAVVAALAAGRAAKREAGSRRRRARELDRAQQWARRGMCPRCEFWHYLDAGELAQCCGGPLVRMEERDGRPAP